MRHWRKFVIGRGKLSSTPFKGLLSTSAWQIANYAIPLLTFPYLARHLGVTAFGIIGIGSAIASYAQLVTDWGFGYSATQSIAQERHRPSALNRIFWATLIAKILLGFVSAAIMCGSAMLLVHDETLRLVIFVSTLNIIGAVFNVDWLLRGLEQLSRFALASIVGRLAAVPLVFILVHGPEQIPEAAFATAAGSLFTAVISLVMAHGLRIIVWPEVTGRDVWLQVKNGFHVFLTTATINLYTDTLIVALGAISGAQQVGLFAGADKVRRPVQSLLAPLSMVFYPRIGYLAAHDPDQAERTSVRLFQGYVAIGLVLATGVSVTASISIGFLLGPGFGAAVAVLRVMAWLILVVAVNTALLTIMMPFGLKKQLSVAAVIGAALGLGSVFPLALYAGAVGAAYAALLAETAVMVSAYCFLVRRLEWFRPFDDLKALVAPAASNTVDEATLTEAVALLWLERWRSEQPALPWLFWPPDSARRRRGR